MANLEAEQAVLGAVMLDNRALWRLGDLQPDDFENDALGRLYGTISQRISTGGTVDLLTARELVEGDGDWAILAGITRNTPSAANAPAYGEIVRAESLKRKARWVLQDALSRVDSDPNAVESCITGLGQVLTRTRSDASLDDCLTAAEAWQAEFDRRRRESSAGGISTTLPTLDQALGGLQGGRLYVLGARPGCFKSALAWQVCLTAARRGDPAGFLSLEMPEWELGGRARKAGFDQRGLPVRVDVNIRALPEIVARLAEWRHRHGCGLAVVDYFQLVECSEGRSRFEQLSFVSRRMKAAAKELDMPILLLAQLSRELERERREPRLSDLRDCGQLEQDADAVVFIHTRQGVGQSSDSFELILAKNRGGPARKAFPLVCDGARMQVGEAIR